MPTKKIKAVVIVNRTIKEGHTYKEFRDAWLPPNLKADPAEEPAQYYGMPVKVINAINIQNPLEVVSIALMDEDHQTILEELPRYEASDNLRAQEQAKVAKDTRGAIFTVQDINELGTDPNEKKPNLTNISYDDFERVDFRSGTVVQVERFERAKKPAYKIWADFGPEIGVLKTSAQVTVHYTPDALLNRRIVGCVNLGEKNIAGFVSQFLLVGFPDDEGGISLITTDPKVPNGKKLS